ncbi:SEC-C motif domain protein (fragment) [Desulfosarcina cetonica]
MTKIGRNQLCPCGSGKKYKKCCLIKPKSDSQLLKKRDELDILMEKGWSLVQENQTTKACDVWLELWDSLKKRFKPEFRDVKEAETIFSGCELIYNWCQDLEVELGNAGIDDSTYYRERIAYCDEFCSIFPASGELLMHNMKRAIAESYFALGNVEEGNKCFKQLIEQYPNNIWGYIGWGDMYLWPMEKDIKPDYNKAEQIYKMAVGKGIEGENHLNDRLNELKKEREKYA